MNDIVCVLLTACIYTLAGYGYAGSAGIGERIERIAVSFLIGIGTVTLTWFLLYRTGLPLDLQSYLLAAGVVGTGGLLVGKRKGQSGSIKAKKVCTKAEKILLGIMTGLAVIHFAITNYTPISAWDSVALYDSAARIIAFSHSLKDLTEASYYMSYPLMVSLAHAAVYLFGGYNAQGLHSLILFSLTAVIYGRVRDWSGNRYALAASFLVLSNYSMYYYSSFAYTNIPYTAFFVGGILYILSAVPGNSRLRHLFLGSLLIGLSTWIRSTEPFWMIGALLIVWQAVRGRRIKEALAPLSIILLIRYAWSSFQKIVFASLPPSEPRPIALSAQSLEKIEASAPELVNYLQHNIVMPYLALWLLIVPIGMAVYVARGTRLKQLFILSLLVFCMAIVGVVVFSTYYATWNSIGDSATRMILFIIPLGIIASVYAWSELMKGNYGSKS